MKMFLATFILSVQVWLAIGIIPLFLGIIHGSQERLGNCHEPMERIEYVVPQYRIGCWLGSAPGQQGKKP